LANKIDNVIRSEEITHDNLEKLIYGLEYDKNLGLKIIRNVLKKRKINKNYIEKLMFDKDLSMKDILEKDVFLLSNNKFSKEIIEAIKLKINIRNIDVFKGFNDIYYRESIAYFIENNYLILNIRALDIKEDINSQYPYSSLLFYKPEVYGVLDRDLLLETNSTIVATITIYDQNNENNLPMNFNYNYSFLDELTDFRDDKEDRDIIFINNIYDDYHLFQDFDDMKTGITFHSFDYHADYSDKGIIFPFYIKSDTIYLYDLDYLSSFVKAKLIEDNLSIIDIKRKYKQLISLTEKLTQESPQWVNFFKSYNS